MVGEEPCPVFFASFRMLQVRVSVWDCMGIVEPDHFSLPRAWCMSQPASQPLHYFCCYREGCAGMGGVMLCCM